MQLSDRQQEIIDEFEFYDSWMDKYQYLIDLGKDLEPLEEAEKMRRIWSGAASRRYG